MHPKQTLGKVDTADVSEIFEKEFLSEMSTLG